MPKELTYEEAARQLQSHIIGKVFLPELKSSEAVDILRSIQDNAVHLSGTTYGIDEKYIDKLNKFLNNLTD